jgi:hypothetical protein
MTEFLMNMNMYIFLFQTDIVVGHPVARPKALTNTEVLKILKTAPCDGNEIPRGNKSNAYIVLDDSENVDRRKNKMHSTYVDDVGSYQGNNIKKVHTIIVFLNTNLLSLSCYHQMTTDFRTLNSLYIHHTNGTLQYVQNVEGVFKTTTGVPVTPQPTEEQLIMVRRHYATSKSGQFKRVITYVHDARDEQLSSLKTKALIQYIGKKSHIIILHMCLTSDNIT